MSKRALSVTSLHEYPSHIATIVGPAEATITEDVVPESLRSRKMSKRVRSVTSLHEYPLHIATIAEPDRATITEDVVPKSLRRPGAAARLDPQAGQQKRKKSTMGIVEKG